MDDDISKRLDDIDDKLTKELRRTKKYEQEQESLIRRLKLDMKKLKSRIISLESENMSLTHIINSTNRKMDRIK